MYAEIFGEQQEQEIADLYHKDLISLEDARDLETKAIAAAGSSSHWSGRRLWLRLPDWVTWPWVDF